MSDPDVTAVSGWDHTVGVATIQLPRVDTLLFVGASTRPGSPMVADLSGDLPAHLGTDRDRAVLRAFLTLALQRLDAQENDPR